MKKIKKINELHFTNLKHCENDDINDTDFIPNDTFDFYILDPENDINTENDKLYNSKIVGLCLKEDNNYRKAEKEEKSLLKKIFRFKDVDKIKSTIESKTYYLLVTFEKDKVPFGHLDIEIDTLFLNEEILTKTKLLYKIKFTDKKQAFKFTKMCKQYCERAILNKVLPKKLNYKKTFDFKNFIF